MDCRTALAFSYVEAYFCESASAAMLFTHAQSQLEEFTDLLQVRILNIRCECIVIDCMLTVLREVAH